MEKVASVSKLKAHLSAYLEQVKAGEEIVVTDRGKPVARVVPIKVETDEEARIERLIREGVLRPGRGGSILETLKNRTRVTCKASVVEALLEEREEGW